MTLVPTPAITAIALPQLPAMPAMPGLDGAAGAAAAVPGVAPVQTAAGTDFGNLVSQGIDSLEAIQNKSSDLAVKAASGDLNSIQDYTISATEASVATQLTVTLRNQAVSAFNQIMQMQV